MLNFQHSVLGCDGTFTIQPNLSVDYVGALDRALVGEPPQFETDIESTYAPSILSQSFYVCSNCCAKYTINGDKLIESSI